MTGWKALGLGGLRSDGANLYRALHSRLSILAGSYQPGSHIPFFRSHTFSQLFLSPYNQIVQYVA